MIKNNIKKERDDSWWDVIVFVPSKEEDEDRITCGNSLIASGNK